MNKSDQEIIKYAIEGYSFILNRGLTTFSDFANEIVKVYSMDNPRNAAIVQTIRKFPQYYVYKDHFCAKLQSVL